jgi:hypothetical protein
MGNNYDPVSLHKYLYANVDPGNLIDPTGNFSLPSLGTAINVMGTLSTVASTTYNVLQFATGEKEVSVGELAQTAVTSLAIGKLGAAGFRLARIVSKQAREFAKKYRSSLCNCCFVEGTLVSTKNGLKPIEKLQVGELVASKNLVTGVIDWKPIVETFIFDDDRKTYELVVESSEGGLSRFEVTDNHPFWVIDKGWVDSADLVSGMQLFSSEGGELHLKEIIKLDRSPVTYNFEVADNHNYFVGKQKVLVHNCSCDKMLSQGLMVRYARVNPSSLKGARATSGAGPGHSRSKHGITPDIEADIINNAQQKFVVINKNGRHVNVFVRNGSVVITEGNDITRIITAYGRAATKNGNKPVDASKWLSDGNFHLVE